MCLTLAPVQVCWLNGLWITLFIRAEMAFVGVWLCDISGQLHPTSILHGMDLDGCRFPTSPPPNVSFSSGSVLSLPSDWTGRFDIVHQRLLMCGLKRDDWPKAINEIHRVLAPGGWAQLGEYISWGYGPAMDTYGRIYSLLYKHNGLVMRAHAELEDWMREAGFKNVKIVRATYPLGDWAGVLGRDGALNIWSHFKDLKEQVLKAGGFGLVANETELDAVIDTVKNEWDETIGTEAVFVYVIGQKA